MIPEEVRKLLKWEQFPEEQKGGQTVGIMNMGSTLICEDLGFSIFCDGSRSQMKNKQFCLTVFELYLEEFKICKTN
jgi:protein subunit release factor A